MDRKERLSLLARANAGRRLFPEFADRLGAALGRPVSYDEFLPLPTSDAIRAEFSRQRTTEPPLAPVLYSGWHEPDRMEADLARLADELGTVLAIFGESDRVGVLPLVASDALARAAALLEATDWWFALTDRTAENSVALCFDSDWRANWQPRPYEAVVSGAAWVVAASPHLRAV